MIPRVLSWVAKGGQIAIQMPYNFDHPSHLIAKNVVERLFPEAISICVEQNDPIPGVDRFMIRDPFGNRLEFLEGKLG